MQNKEKTIQITVKVKKITYESLKMLAAHQHVAVSDVVRRFIDKGITVDAYKEDLDIITQVVRQEIKAQMTPQVDRLVKILIKIGKISAGLYYTTIKTLMRMVGSTKVETFKELATESRKLGIKYMKYKDHEIDKYLEDDDMIFADIEKL